MADYITATEFKTRIGATTNTSDLRIAEHIAAASREIDSMCGRRFNADAAATARIYHPIDSHRVIIDDALEITAVATDTADDGSYSTSWASTDYATYPLNGVGPNRQSGWPTTQLVAIENRTFPLHRRASVQVTAKWGWTAVPDDVKEACYLIAHRLYYERDVPSGVLPGSAEFGGTGLRELRSVDKLLKPYKRYEPNVA
jgi:hypothetical protein